MEVATSFNLTFSLQLTHLKEHIGLRPAPFSKAFSCLPESTSEHDDGEEGDQTNVRPHATNFQCLVLRR